MSLWDILTNAPESSPFIVRWIALATCFFIGCGLAFAKRNKVTEGDQ